MKWQFITPTAPHQNGCTEALVKSCKRALKKAIGDQKLAPFELYTYFLEVANLINECPIGRTILMMVHTSVQMTSCWEDHQVTYHKVRSGRQEIPDTESSLFSESLIHSGNVGCETYFQR